MFIGRRYEESFLVALGYYGGHLFAHLAFSGLLSDVVEFGGAFACDACCAVSVYGGFVRNISGMVLDFERYGVGFSIYDGFCPVPVFGFL